MGLAGLDVATMLGIALFGGLGALTRFGAQKLWPTTSSRIPMGVLGVNVAGSLIAGLVAGLVGNENHVLSSLLIVGFCGGLTTFSTFVVESVQLAKARALPAAVLNVLLTSILGVGAAVLGLILGTALA